MIYQVYPRSFADSDGDGMGDLPGVTARLPALAELGVDAVWLSPFYPSPQNDAGYDVRDYRDVDPMFGTLTDADELVRTAHDLGLRVVVDIVPNHSSSEHPWFAAALASPPGSPERARYVFRDGRGPGGDEPPNNWRAAFGGPAWARVREADGSLGQWYLHLFDRTQPDWNWDNPEVHEDFVRTLRFWLDRGVDGFRIDVAHALVKDPGLPDYTAPEGLAALMSSADHADPPPMWDQDGVHEVYREWRKVLDGYDGDRMLVGEAWVAPYSRIARYLRPDELHQAFNFVYGVAPWRAAEQRWSIEVSLAGSAEVGATTTWTLSNHDLVRHASRFGYSPDEQDPLVGIGPDDPQPDAVLGLRRARAATVLMLALPGSAYLYQGEELGLPDHTTLPGEARQDPTWLRTNGTQIGRDGCRVPIPWEGDRPSYGFGPSGASWLPQPATYGELARDRQEGVEGSTLELYRAALRLRRELRLGRGELDWGEVDWDTGGRDAGGRDAAGPGEGSRDEGSRDEGSRDEGGSGEDDGGKAGSGEAGSDRQRLVVVRRGVAGPDVTVLVNFAGAPLPLPPGAEVLLSSAPLLVEGDARLLPADTTVWLRRH